MIDWIDRIAGVTQKGVKNAIEVVDYVHVHGA
jgi:hypothetical protein